MEIIGDIGSISGFSVSVLILVNGDIVNSELMFRNSIGSFGSIELIEDSLLRILEECERVREEIILLIENFLLDFIIGFEDEFEWMDFIDDVIVGE